LLATTFDTAIGARGSTASTPTSCASTSSLDGAEPRWRWDDWGPHSQAVRSFARPDCATIGDKVEIRTRLGTLYSFVVEDLAPMSSLRGIEIALRSMAAATRYEPDARLLRHAAAELGGVQ